MYTIKELFDDLPLSIRQLAQIVKINEVTLARIRDGKPTRRPTANKLLLYFSDLYKEKYTLRNVTGIHILEYTRKETAPCA
jgi:transcriptional regulator with XRE-family HTH domain